MGQSIPKSAMPVERRPLEDVLADYSLVEMEDADATIRRLSRRQSIARRRQRTENQRGLSCRKNAVIGFYPS